MGSALGVLRSLQKAVTSVKAWAEVCSGINLGQWRIRGCWVRELWCRGGTGRPVRRLAPSFGEDRGPRSVEWKQPSELGWGGCFPVPRPPTLLPLLEAWPRAQPLLCGAALVCSGPGHSFLPGLQGEKPSVSATVTFLHNPQQDPWLSLLGGLSCRQWQKSQRRQPQVPRALTGRLPGYSSTGPRRGG